MEEKFPNLSHYVWLPYYYLGAVGVPKAGCGYSNCMLLEAC